MRKGIVAVATIIIIAVAAVIYYSTLSPSPTPAVFEVSNLVISPLEVEPGEEVTISATITNVGEESGSYTVEINLDDEVIDTESVTLNGGESTSITFTVTRNTKATYSVEVAGLSSSFTVVCTQIVVTSTADSGPGTLRQALLEAQTGDIITFNSSIFPPEAPVTVYLTSSLPPISQGSLTIDGSNAGVVLDGSTIKGEWVNGLEITSDGNIIRGLQVIDFSGAAIGLLDGAQHNIIGGDRGVGSGPLGQGNLLSGNGSFGVGIWDADTSFNTIIGNYIGTDLSGTVAGGISGDGVHVYAASHNHIVNNLISGNGQSGIYICCDGEGNTIRDNLIGTDISGLNSLNNLDGVSIAQNAHNNIIGSNNIIAHNIQHGILISHYAHENIIVSNIIAFNKYDGVSILGSSSFGNNITQNSIHSNKRQGIGLWEGANTELTTPIIFDYDLAAGTAIGASHPDCIVEFFSDDADEGEIYEGRTISDSLGCFNFNKGASFTGPCLTATAISVEGDTSEFSTPTTGLYRHLILQEGNDLPKTLVTNKQSMDLEDNRIGCGWGGLWNLGGYQQLEEILNGEILGMGLKRVRLNINAGQLDLVNWSSPEFSIDPSHDEWITSIANNGIKITYVLNFWDKAGWAEGRWDSWNETGRFKTEEEIQRYLDFVRFIVSHFKDRVQYFEVWNEWNQPELPWGNIELADYINLVHRVVPVIREECPEAKIVVGSISEPFDPDFAGPYFFGILRSDIMPLVDAIAWHPFYGSSPESIYPFREEYYYNYSSWIQEVKDVASSHGFKGEYVADEILWLSYEEAGPMPWQDPTQGYSTTDAAKYLGRGIVMNLGMNITVTALVSPDRPRNMIVKNLCTIMAGAEPFNMSIEIESEATNIRNYSFSLPNGDRLVSLWTDGVAVDQDPGVKANLTIYGLTAQDVIGIDVLNGFGQPIMISNEDGNLIIRNLIVRDYPLILHITKPS